MAQKLNEVNSEIKQDAPGIISQIDSLKSGLLRLSGKIYSLQTKLESVLSPGPEDDAEVAPDCGGAALSPMGHDLKALTCKVENMIRYIDDVFERLMI